METGTFRDVLRRLDVNSFSTVEKGRSFEELVKFFIEQDVVQAMRFCKVWLWEDWPHNNQRRDTGIDLVAQERNTGEFVAIQCKFYEPNNRIGLDEVNKFLSAYGTVQFASGIFVSTSDNLTHDAAAAFQNRDKPVVRWGPDIFENSSIDWRTFNLTQIAEQARQAQVRRDQMTDLLIHMVNSNQAQTALELIAAGAEINVRVGTGFTPLEFAIALGHIETAIALITAGADLNVRSPEGFTPLHSASFAGHTDIVRALISAGADLDASNEDGVTPLELAFTAGEHTEIANALITAGAEY